MKRFLKSATLYEGPKNRRNIKKSKISKIRKMMVDSPIMFALDNGVIDDSQAILLMRIDNFCWYDEEGKLHSFYGSDEYLAKLSHCSIPTIERRIAFLKKHNLIGCWYKTRKIGREIPKTIRYILTPWTKNQNEWLEQWAEKARKEGWIK